MHLSPKKYFITAIGTGSGKTVVSAIVCEALKADYWKPVQSGTEEIDSETVKNLISNNQTSIHPENFKLKMPASPNIAAKAEGKTIYLKAFSMPVTQNTLVIEGAGGILVPINEQGEYVIDLAAKFEAEVILVVNIYLGCINHTLLTISELNRRNIKIKGLVFNQSIGGEIENTILTLSGLPCLLQVGKEEILSKKIISHYASMLTLKD